eukprot:1909775-Amphidinium_carterae.1
MQSRICMLGSPKTPKAASSRRCNLACGDWVTSKPQAHHGIPRGAAHCECPQTHSTGKHENKGRFAPHWMST